MLAALEDFGIDNITEIPLFFIHISIIFYTHSLYSCRFFFSLPALFLILLCSFLYSVPCPGIFFRFLCILLRISFGIHWFSFLLRPISFTMMTFVDFTKTSVRIYYFEFQFPFCPLYLLFTLFIYFPSLSRRSGDLLFGRCVRLLQFT